MTLYTREDFELNHEARLNTLRSINHYRDMVALHTKANRPALAKSALTRLADDEYQLYRLNKDYDEMIIANMTIELPPRKSLIKKLLRK